MKCLKYPDLIQPHGWRYVELGTPGSKSSAAEKVELLSNSEFDHFYPPVPASQFSGDRAFIGKYGWTLFHERLKRELTARVKPGDIIGHPFGKAHEEIVGLYPQCQHVELGIGYGDSPFGCWRIFESSGWRQYHWGRWEATLQSDKGQNRSYSWVIPNSFYIDDWPYSPPEENLDYVLYMGRIDECKGMTTIAAIIRENSKQAEAGAEKLLKFVFAGQGNFEQALMKHVLMDPAPNPVFLDIEHRGVVNGKTRAALAGQARCLLAPTNFIEPFNGSHVESMICGTPAVTASFGAFCETFTQGLDGFRCHTLGDYLAAIRASKYLDRKGISDRARAKYSIEACGKQYDAALRQIAELSGPGWYSTKSWSIPDLTPKTV